MQFKKCLSTAVISHGICCLHQSNAFAPKTTHVVLKPISSTSNTLLHQSKEDPRSYGGNVPKSNNNYQRGNNGTNQSRNSNQNKNRNTSRNTNTNKNPTGKRLESSLSNLFDISQGSSVGKYDSDSYSAQDGDIDIYESMSSSTRNSKSMEPQDDAPLLDESMYVNSEQYMDEDGSFVGKKNSQLDNDMQELLVTLMNDHPDIPQDDEFTQEYGFGGGYAYNSNTNTNTDTDTDTDNSRASAPSIPEGNTVDDQALLESISSKNNANADTSIDGEELHKRVFANEMGFLQQSELFRESLVPDPDQEKRNEAAILRRGAEYRKQQEETLKHMFEEMDEFERSILSRDDAEKLASDRNANVANARIDDNGTIDVSGESELDLEPTTILCSKCSCLMSAEEIIFERKKGRPNPSEMICRLCQVDSMKVKKGSPYLMGRFGRNGKLPPRMGMSSPPTNRIVRQKIEQIRKIGPRNEDVNEEIHSSSNLNSGEAVPKDNGKRTRTEAQSNAWREQYTNAMSQQRGVLMTGASTSTPPSASTSTSTSTSTSLSSMTNGTNTLSNGNDQGNTGSTSNDHQIHRYSNRPQELKMKKDTYADESVWNAHFKAAMYRQQGIEHTGVAYKSKTAAIGNTTTSMNTSTNSNTNTNNGTIKSPNNQGKDAEAKTKAEAEIKNLRGQINNLQETIGDYKEQLEKSSKQIIALQSIMEGMKKSINRPVKRKPSPWNTDAVAGTSAGNVASTDVDSTNANGEGNDARSKVVKEVGEGVVRSIGQRHSQSQPIPRRPVERSRRDVDHDEMYLDDP